MVQVPRSKLEDIYPIIISGGSGLLGSNLVKLDERIKAPTREEFNINNPPRFARMLQYNNVRTYIHCAGITQKKLKETNKDTCYVTNAMSTLTCARICKEMKIRMVYISTDYVFDGEKGNYEESDTPNPLNYYAFTKVCGEMAALANGHKVIRTSFCPDEWPYEFAFDDKITSGDKASIIAGLIMKSIYRSKFWSRILHIGTQPKTFYELALSTGIAVKPNKIKDVEDKIPKDTSLNISRMEAIMKRSTLEL